MKVIGNMIFSETDDWSDIPDDIKILHWERSIGYAMTKAKEQADKEKKEKKPFREVENG